MKGIWAIMMTMMMMLVVGGGGDDAEKEKAEEDDAQLHGDVRCFQLLRPTSQLLRPTAFTAGANGQPKPYLHPWSAQPGQPVSSSEPAEPMVCLQPPTSGFLWFSSPKKGSHQRICPQPFPLAARSAFN